MSGTSLEVADIFRDHGAAWRASNKGHVNLNQMKVMCKHTGNPLYFGVI